MTSWYEYHSQFQGDIQGAAAHHIAHLIQEKELLTHHNYAVFQNTDQHLFPLKHEKFLSTPVQALRYLIPPILPNGASA